MSSKPAKSTRYKVQCCLCFEHFNKDYVKKHINLKHPDYFKENGIVPVEVDSKRRKCPWSTFPSEALPETPQSQGINVYEGDLAINIMNATKKKQQKKVGPVSAYNLRSKKRQNEDIPTEQFADSKHPCFDDASQRLPGFTKCGRKSPNDLIEKVEPVDEAERLAGNFSPEKLQPATPDSWLEKYQARCVAFAEGKKDNSLLCRTLYCPGWIPFEGNITSFVCPVCMTINCLECQTVHQGQDCRQYQDSLTLQSNTLKEEDECNKKATYRALVALDDVDLVSSVEQFECPVCYVEVMPGEGVVLQECLHSFCRQCLASCIEHSDTASVKCPFANEEYSCESDLLEREIKCLVTPDMYKKYLTRSVALAESQAPNSFHCKTSDCPGWCFFEDNVNTFFCPVCMRSNCLTCRAIHDGRDCRQYQEWLELQISFSEEARRTQDYLKKRLRRGKAMKCPGCQVILMKKEGCDWIRCSMCHLEVCWATKGPRWGPGGHGDTSGGCKCNLNGVRCHPECRYCH